eukprot:14921_1
MSNHQKCVEALQRFKSKHPKLLDDFLNWYKDQAFEDDNLNDEFVENGMNESEFIDLLREKKRIAKPQDVTCIWEALHDALSVDEHKSPSTESENESMTSIVVELLSQHIHTAVDDTLYPPIVERIKQQAPLLLTGIQKTTQDILHVEYIASQNKNYPLLLHFVDSYIRCQMNEWIMHSKRNLSVKEFFTIHCKNTCFTDYWSVSDSRMDVIQSAITSYQHRVLPPFQFMHPTFKITDTNPLIIANYLFEMARIVGKCVNQPIYNKTHIIPVQIDFILVNGKIKCIKTMPNNMKGITELFGAEDPNEDDHESKQDENQCFPDDFGKLFKSNKIKHHVYKMPSQDMLRCTEDLKKLSDNKRCTRSVFIVDQRKKKAKLYLFRPKEWNTFADNEQNLVHCSLHHNTIKSMVPRKGRQPDYSALETVRGQMFIISYHVMSREEIRCYVFYEAQCFRFYGEDLINVIPIFFDDTDKAKQILLNAYQTDQKWKKNFETFCDTFVDKKFDRFYYGLTATHPRIDVNK